MPKRTSLMRIPLRLSFALLLLSLSACSLMPSQQDVMGKFSATMREDVGVFYDQTVSMLTDADLTFDAAEAVYTREYFDPQMPEVVAFVAKKQEVKKGFVGIVKYSLELVKIAEKQIPEEEKIKLYADYMAAISGEGRYKMRFGEDEFNRLITEIRAQKTFRDALIKAQPILQAANQAINNALVEMTEATDALVKVTETKIDQRYALVIRYQQALEKEKQETLVAIGYLYGAMKGTPGAYQQLLDTKTIIDPRLIPKGEPRFEDLKKIGEHLSWKMDSLHKVEKEITPDWEVYRATHRELDALAGMAMKKTTRARAVALLWTRAHQKMAAGQSKPAEWIDYKDVSKIIDLVL